jgi:hypoxanthine-DNA glycosylase
MPSPLTGLAPIFDAEIDTLILGSFPSPASLAAQQYYGHPQNQFWRLVGGIVGEALAGLPYGERKARLLHFHLGVWDVYRACIRPGALDADIRQGQPNDIAGLLKQTPRVRRLFFNGQAAGRFAAKLASATGLPCAILPSSSPAYTLAFAEKLQRWQAAFAATN